MRILRAISIIIAALIVVVALCVIFRFELADAGVAGLRRWADTLPPCSDANPRPYCKDAR